MFKPCASIRYPWNNLYIHYCTYCMCGSDGDCVRDNTCVQQLRLSWQSCLAEDSVYWWVKIKGNIAKSFQICWVRETLRSSLFVDMSYYTQIYIYIKLSTWTCLVVVHIHSISLYCVWVLSLKSTVGQENHHVIHVLSWCQRINLSLSVFCGVFFATLQHFLGQSFLCRHVCLWCCDGSESDFTPL